VVLPKPAGAEMSVTAAVRPAAGSGGYGVDYRFRGGVIFMQIVITTLLGFMPLKDLQ